MIKAIVKITKPFDLDISEEDFVKGIFNKTGRMKVHPAQGRLYKKRVVKRDEIGNLYMEITHIISDESVKRFFEGPQTKRKIEDLKKDGYVWNIKYYDISPEIEKFYSDHFNSEKLYSDHFKGMKLSKKLLDKKPKYDDTEDAYGLCGESKDKICNCRICQWARTLEMPNKHEHDGPPTKLEHIGKTGYEK